MVPNYYHQSLNAPTLDEEIKAAVFMGCSDSAPGPDGFNFHFYKSSWHIIGSVVCKAIKSFFIKCYMPNCVKATALAIIPKHKNAVNISDYRPIALCNVVYKIIAKVIAVRLKLVMSTIVKDNQAGFLKSRVSTDNILLASDILYHAGKRVLLNGALEGYFPSTAGLRQGYPMSPYLFYLVMDAFSNLLEERGFKGISFKDFSLTHLLYADDVLIFGEASLENCSLLVSILKNFATVSGLHVNYDKSAIMFPKHLNNHSAICQALSIHNIASKITYLAWDKVCLPFSKGGLGISSIPALQFSFNCSLILRLYNSSSPLSSWLLNKYCSPWRPPAAVASNLWKSICFTANSAKHCFKFRITKSAPISVQWDHWYNNRNLAEFGCSSWDHIPDIALNTIISDDVWILPDSFPTFLKDLFAGINDIGEEGPCLLWYDKKNYDFKNFLLEFHSEHPNCYWHRMIWHKRKALKFSVYAWLALTGGLKTADALRLRNIYVPSVCRLCHMFEESVSHIFFECSYSFAILGKLLLGMNNFLLRPNILQVFDWLNGQYNGNSELYAHLDNDEAPRTFPWMVHGRPWETRDGYDLPTGFYYSESRLSWAWELFFMFLAGEYHTALWTF
ncbi:uncharacterized protein LOC110114345 [Dendrobium catenatum]|uniref:uncharacterized protein LOC110114345 n=1 Tax=Dendrobium catenatum TaxID=906689 RepID=UPI0009F235E9|nr:uncharacterized protein LOC110114345 [Dendrobium catenatum]